jgi:hypothetical protein
MKLKSVQFYGRPAKDVCEMFNLDVNLKSLQGFKILDCPGGPSSFTAALSAAGADVIACDPLYALSNEQLYRKFLDSQNLIRSDYINSGLSVDYLDNIHETQRSAFLLFSADRDAHPQRYLEASLPYLPFHSKSFDLVVSGNLLFSYAPTHDGGLMEENGFDLDWHRQALDELCRVSRSEVRIYPAHTNTLIARRHDYATWFLNNLSPTWRGEFMTSNYFQGMIGCTDGLRLWRDH